ncbi:MAG: TraR/DksA C4-type zinc finger protein [Dechloromonas sp.]|jgi:phage/conjugal plasmid C-4 type zinc finger TraR family protein|nr:TraR/DksA C4-type zinc finger protein [Dechloromonas sp.]
MPDDIDRAQEREEEMRSDALAEYRRRAHGDPAVPSAWQCAVCGEYLPELRRRLIPGVQTCVECQGDREARSRGPFGDATAERDAAPRAVAGAHCAGRSPCGGPSSDAPGRDLERALNRHEPLPFPSP